MWGGVDDGQGPLMTPGPVVGGDPTLMGGTNTAGIWNQPPGAWNMPPRGTFPPNAAYSQQPPRKPWDPPNTATSTPPQWPGAWPPQGAPPPVANQPPPAWQTGMPPPNQYGKPTGAYADANGGRPPMHQGARGGHHGRHQEPPQWAQQQPPLMGGKDWGRPNDPMGTIHWGDPSTGGPHWGPGVPPPPGMHDPTGAHWSQARAPDQQWGGPPPPGGGPHRGPNAGASQPMQQWGQAPPMHAGPPPHNDSSRNQAGSAVPSAWDMNPQNPSMWVPPPKDIDNDMMWHDPNPRTKKIQVDKGTAAWGDPQSQGEIKRWKLPDDPNGVPKAQTATKNGWTLANASIGNQENVAPPATGWGDGPTTSASTPHNIGSSTWATPPSGGQGDSPSNVGGAWSQSIPKEMHYNEEIAQRIAEQLRVAVSKGLIDVSVLHRPLPKETLLLLNNLLMRAPQFDQAKLDLEKLQSIPVPNEQQMKEIAQQRETVQRLQEEIQSYQRQISMNAGQPAVPAPDAETPAPGSRLHKWKEPGAASTDVAPSSEGSSSSAGNSMHYVASAPSMKNDMPVWSSGANSGEWDGGEKPPKSAADVQEFVPGKPWMYQDPKSLENDPTATPGSSRPGFGSFSAMSFAQGNAQMPGSVGSSGSIGHTTPTADALTKEDDMSRALLAAVSGQRSSNSAGAGSSLASGWLGGNDPVWSANSGDAPSQ